MTTPPKILIVTSDMMSIFPIEGTARDLGIESALVMNPEHITTEAASDVTLVIVDLDMPALDPSDIVAAFPEPRPVFLGFYPHVRKDLHDQAVSAGFDQVISRGRFTADLNDILGRCTPQQP